MINLLFYADQSYYDGHLAMTIKAIDAILQTNNYNIIFIYSKCNKKLSKQVSLILYKYTHFSELQIEYTSGLLQEIKSFFLQKEVEELSFIIQKCNPSLIIVSHSHIELSALMLKTAKKLNIKIISYLPLVHDLQYNSSLFASVFKDIIRNNYYNIPSRYITVCKNMQVLLQAKTQHKIPINVVYNALDFSNMIKINKSEAREKLGFSNNDYIVAIIGRVYFKQKGQDYIVKAIASNKHKLGNIKLLILGDGPDKSALFEIVRDVKASSHVVLHPWSSDLSFVYSAIDMLAIPSWFEGFPLVLLEAMYYKLPIIASNIDIMKEILPENWIFTVGNSENFIQTILNIKANNYDNIINNNYTFATEQFSLTNFYNNFLLAITEELK